MAGDHIMAGMATGTRGIARALACTAMPNRSPAVERKCPGENVPLATVPQKRACRACDRGTGTACDDASSGGRGGIRTPGGVPPTTVFKTAAINRTLPPFRRWCRAGRARTDMPPPCLAGRLCPDRRWRSRWRGAHLRAHNIHADSASARLSFIPARALASGIILEVTGGSPHSPATPPRCPRPQPRPGGTSGYASAAGCAGCRN